jgi:hypothetical protein
MYIYTYSLLYSSDANFVAFKAACLQVSQNISELNPETVKTNTIEFTLIIWCMAICNILFWCIMKFRNIMWSLRCWMVKIIDSKSLACDCSGFESRQRYCWILSPEENVKVAYRFPVILSDVYLPDIMQSNVSSLLSLCDWYQNHWHI